MGANQELMEDRRAPVFDAHQQRPLGGGPGNADGSTGLADPSLGTRILIFHPTKPIRINGRHGSLTFWFVNGSQGIPRPRSTVPAEGRQGHRRTVCTFFFIFFPLVFTFSFFPFFSFLTDSSLSLFLIRPPPSHRLTTIVTPSPHHRSSSFYIRPPPPHRLCISHAPSPTISDPLHPQRPPTDAVYEATDMILAMEIDITSSIFFPAASSGWFHILLHSTVS